MDSEIGFGDDHNAAWALGRELMEKGLNHCSAGGLYRLCHDPADGIGVVQNGCWASFKLENQVISQ